MGVTLEETRALEAMGMVRVLEASGALEATDAAGKPRMAAVLEERRALEARGAAGELGVQAALGYFAPESACELPGYLTMAATGIGTFFQDGPKSELNEPNMA